MFHIEDKHDDLVELLNHDGHGSRTEIGESAERLGEEVGTLADMLRRTYREMEEMGNCDIPVYFSHIDGIKELDEQAQEVVADILRDLCGDINYQLRQLTKYDRVDPD